MNYAKFEEHLLVYGADIGTWPELLQSEALQALSINPLLIRMQGEAHQFEQHAMQRPTLKDDSSFAERIIALARAKDPSLTRRQRLNLILQEISDLVSLPKPIYALASIALAGFLLGTVFPAESTAADITTHFLYETRGLI